MRNLFLLSLILFVTTSCHQRKTTSEEGDKEGTTTSDEGTENEGGSQAAGEFVLTYNDISEFEGASLTFKTKGKTLSVSEGKGCVVLKQADFNSLEITFKAGTETKSCSNIREQPSINPRVRKPTRCYTEAFYGHKKITLSGRGAFMGALAGGRYSINVEDRDKTYQPSSTDTCKKLVGEESQ